VYRKWLRTWVPWQRGWCAEGIVLSHQHFSAYTGNVEHETLGHGLVVRQGI